MDDLSKKFYYIADVSEIIGVPQSTLRFWEKKFPQLRPRRSDGQTRLYTPADIELLQLINFLLKERGLKIEAARDYIRHNRADLDRRHQIIKRLVNVRTRLTALLDELNTRR